MQTIWHIRGTKAGSFELVEDDEAKNLCSSGDAQIADGLTPLSYPEGHPHHEPTVAPKKKIASKRKYPNKMMVTDASVGIAEED